MRLKPGAGCGQRVRNSATRPCNPPTPDTRWAGRILLRPPLRTESHRNNRGPLRYRQHRKRRICVAVRGISTSKSHRDLRDTSTTRTACTKRRTTHQDTQQGVHHQHRTMAPEMKDTGTTGRRRRIGTRISSNDQTRCRTRGCRVAGAHHHQSLHQGHPNQRERHLPHVDIRQQGGAARRGVRKVGRSDRKQRSSRGC